MAGRKSTKPWLHKASSFFCAEIDGKRHYLDKDFNIACRKLRRLRKEAERPNTSAARDWLDAPFVELTDEFLDDIKARRSEGTYRNARERLLRGLRIIGADVRVGEIRRFHLSKIEQKLTGDYSPSTIRDTLATVQQVFNFAVSNDLLEYSPLVGYQKPAGRGRSRLMMPGEFQSLLRNADACFRRFLLAVRLTGCRPGEARLLIWEMVDLDNGMWIIPEHKTVTMQREPMPRVIPLSDTIWSLCRWLAREPHSAEDHVFLNQLGNPYTKDCLVKKMDRVRTRAGIEKVAGETLVLYSHRHAYATSVVGRVSDTELATLMGHTTTRMLRRYVHLNRDHLRDIQRRAQG